MEKIIITKKADDPVKRIRVKTWLSGNYGKRGINFYEYIDGVSDLERICSKSKISEEEGAGIVKYLSSIKAIEIKYEAVKEKPKTEAGKEKPKTEFKAEKTEEKEKKGVNAGAIETGKPEEAYEEKTDSTEKEIFGLFGEEGIIVFNLIDGKRTVKEIIVESKIPKENVIKIIKKINEIGVVKI